jgi:hypothetical protein
MPPGPHHRTQGHEALVGDGGIQVLFDDDAARGAARLDALELLAAPDAAPDVENDLPQGGAHGNFDEARVVDLAGEGEDFGTLGLLGSYRGEPLGSLGYNYRDIGQGFHVVDYRGLTPESLYSREWGLGDGHAPVALYGFEQGRFLAADKGAGAQPYLHIEGEIGAQDILAHEAHGLGLLDGYLEPLDGQGIFGADVDIALVGAHGPSGDHHGFENGMGIAFYGGAVHIGAGIALVGIADDVFHIAFHLGCGLPLETCGEAGAAAPAQA